MDESAPTRTILCAGAGSFETAQVTLTKGIHVGDVPDAAEQVEARWAEIGDPEGAVAPENAWAQGKSELQKAGLAVA